MMMKAMIVATSASAGLAALASEVRADHRCGSGYAVECYQKVRRPDVYATVERPVVVAPGHREFRHEPAVIQNRPYQVQVAPQRVHVEHVPAVYSTVTRRQLVEPARVGYVHQPAVIERVLETVVTHPGGLRWERSFGRDGQERICKVHVPAQTATIARDVVVSPARSVPVATPAVYREVAVPVIVAPAHTRHIVEPAQYAIEHRPVVLRPASTVIVDHPPVIGLQRQQVLVQGGGYGWQRTGGDGDYHHHW